jgi:hypothetical protein
MNKEKLLQYIKNIVEKSKELKDEYTDEINARVNYACVFCQSDKEFDHLVAVAKELGSIVHETSTGPLFNIAPLETVSGILKLIKIRKYDVQHPEWGDSDFTVNNYIDFKSKYLNEDGFSLIKRENFEMIELMKKDFAVRVYFSNPPLDEELGIK